MLVHDRVAYGHCHAEHCQPRCSQVSSQAVMELPQCPYCRENFVRDVAGRAIGVVHAKNLAQCPIGECRIFRGDSAAVAENRILITRSLLGGKSGHFGTQGALICSRCDADRLNPKIIPPPRCLTHPCRRGCYCRTARWCRSHRSHCQPPVSVSARAASR